MMKHRACYILMERIVTVGGIAVCEHAAGRAVGAGGHYTRPPWSGAQFCEKSTTASILLDFGPG